MKLTICIPNYNKALDLINLLEDIKNQTSLVDKIIICDDYSNQDQLEIVKKYINKSTLNITFLQNTKNLGMMNTINNLIDLVKTDFVTIFHNDDRISKYYVQNFKDIIQKNNNYNIYTCNGCAIDDNLNLINEFRIFSKNKVLPKIKSLKHLSKISFFSILSINGTSVYKTSFLKNNKFDNFYKTEADLFSGIKFLSTQDIFYIDKPLYFVTINNKTQSYGLRKDILKLKAYTNNVLNILDYFYSQKIIDNFFYFQYKSILFGLIIKNKIPLDQSLRLLNSRPYNILTFFVLLIYYQTNQVIKKAKFILNKQKIYLYLPS